MNDKQRKAYEEFFETDFSFEIPKLARFRVNAFNQNRGCAAVFRTIPSVILSLDDLGAPRIFKDISMHPRGLVLVTGPTGSGKSTTLAAMVDYVNDNKPDHIITIEDPIEFVHESKRSLINQRELHRDTHGFSEALRSALREDPDVILVGEMRDLETIRLALTAAETGHLVFGTLHTSSAAKTIDRIVDVFPAAEKEMVRTMLSESLRAVARAIASGELREEILSSMSTGDALRALTALPGIGAWSAGLVLRRGFGRLDVFPPGDVGVARALGALLRMRSQASLARSVERSGEARGYLYYCALGAALLERGLIRAASPAPGAAAAVHDAGTANRAGESAT
jgi:energy-coupling factor transporter ATP-binding protein EcfA2